MEWKIYYGDKTTFSNEDGLPEDTPATNVQVIVQTNAIVGRELLSGKDFYLRRGEEWIGVDLAGLLDQLMAMGVLKCGRTLTHAEWNGVNQMALADSDFPRKSARFPSEKR